MRYNGDDSGGLQKGTQWVGEGDDHAGDAVHRAFQVSSTPLSAVHPLIRGTLNGRAPDRHIREHLQVFARELAAPDGVLIHPSSASNAVDPGPVSFIGRGACLRVQRGGRRRQADRQRPAGPETRQHRALLLVWSSSEEWPDHVTTPTHSHSSQRAREYPRRPLVQRANRL